MLHPTDDKGEKGRENARIALEEQSFLMWARFVKNARPGDLQKVDFKKDVWPIFDKSCLRCHGKKKRPCVACQGTGKYASNKKKCKSCKGRGWAGCS